MVRIGGLVWLDLVWFALIWHPDLAALTRDSFGRLRSRWWEVGVVRIGGTQAPALCLNQLLVVTQAGVATHHRRRLTHL